MLAAVTAGVETESFAMLWLVAYVFLLRLPSEALPMEKGEASELRPGGQAVICLEVGVLAPQRVRSLCLVCTARTLTLSDSN